MKSKNYNNLVYVPLQPCTDVESDKNFIDETSSLLKDTDIYSDIDDKLFNERKKPKRILNYIVEQLDNCKHNKIYADVKCGILFIFLVVITMFIALNPEQEFNFHEFSVSKPYSPYINESVPKHASLLRLVLRGPLLLGTLKEYSNISIVITNIDCLNQMGANSTYFQSLCQKIWTIGIASTNIEHERETYLTKYFSIDPTFSSGEVKIEMKTDSIQPVSLGVNFIFMNYSLGYQIFFSAFILIGVYILIIFELVHRSIAAILGSLAAIATLSTQNLRPSLPSIISWLDFDTLCLLFGMMLIVGIFSETGFFDWMAFKAFKMARGKPWILLITLCSVSAIVSAFLDNVTTMLLFTPVSIRLCEALKMDPKRVLIASVLFSNIGGTATAIGDPPNVILVSSKELKANGVNFTSFTLHMSIGSLFVFLASILYLRFLYRDLSSTIGDVESYRIIELKREIEVWKRSAYSITIASQEEATVRALLLEKTVQLEHDLSIQKHVRRPSAHFRETLHQMEDKYCIKDKWLLIKCSIVLGIVILSFFLSSIISGFYLDLGWIAFVGGMWIIVLSDFANLEVILDKVEWATLIFFAALFVLMRALEELNFIAWIGFQISELILMVPETYRLLVSIILVLWISAIASSFVDNIPFTTAMIPVILELGNHMSVLPLVWALAFGACLGGNGTLIGASANVVVAGIAQSHGYSFSFMDFFKVGFPMMIFSTLIALIYLLICHILIGWNLF